MKKIGLLLVGMMAGITLMVGLLWFGSIQTAIAKSGQLLGTAIPAQTTDEGEAVGQTNSAQGSDEKPPAGLVRNGPSLNVLATPVPGKSLIYFVPTDNDATATVLYLFNTDAVSHTVALRGYSYNGTLVYSLNINVGAQSFLRLVSDSVAAAPPPSWATPAPVVTNFTDFTYFASLSLPRGVKVEGYTLYNPGTGVVDPRLDQGAVPIRFSTDPATVFLPAVGSGN